jgi:hypothetical protein
MIAMNKLMIAAAAALSLAAFQASAQSYAPSVAGHEDAVVHQAPVVSGQQDAGAAYYSRGVAQSQNQSRNSETGFSGVAGGF